MTKITVTEVDATNNSLTIKFKCKGKIRKFFTSNIFFAEYETCIENVPESILVIPFLSTVCPVAWACKADIYLQNIDETFYESLKHIQKIFQKYYPKIGFKGTVHAKNIIKTEAKNYTKTMMLFSGGVDSILTYIRHRNENPLMAIIQGADIHINNNETWNTTINANDEFVKQTKSRLTTIKSNFRDLLNECVLTAYYEKKINDYWYLGVCHGFALVGLCAPLTFIEKSKIIYHASSHTKEVEKMTGPHLEIDQKNGWSGTTVEFDGVDLSRQEKIFVIANYMKTSGNKFPIRCCMEQKKELNCSVCEKCSRTILGLEAAGIDPNEVGFKVNNETFRTIKKKIESNQFFTSIILTDMWQDIQHHTDEAKVTPHSEAKDLLDWLKTVEIKVHTPKSEKAYIPNFRVFCRRYLPYSMYSPSKKVFEKFKRYNQQERNEK